MRLSDYENEEAVEVLADMIEPAAIIMADPRVAEMFNSGKPKILLVKYALKEHKKSVVELIAALHRQKPKELKFTMISLIKDLLDIMNDPELQSVFTLQGQETEGEHSGAVTETTTEKDQ